MDERLERLKAQYEYTIDQLRKGRATISPIDPSDFKWLIQQAKRVQELEKDNKRLRDLNYHNNLPAMKSMIENIERYKEALEFYADEKNHEYKVTYDMADVIESEVMKDYGNKAREALYECPDCNGTGYDHSGSIPDHMTPCFKCRGYGTLKGVEG